MEPEDFDEVDALTFAGELQRDEPGLARAALLFSREIAYPELTPSRYLARLDEWANAVAYRMRKDTPGLEKAQTLARFLFRELGIEGNEQEYYDPRNSYLNEVMDRRLGIPIALSALFLHIAHQIGLTAEGIGLPGHFIVAVREGETQHFFDPFEGGASLERPELRDLLEQRTGYRGPFNSEWLKPVDLRAILARMLLNLRSAYIAQDDWPKAALVVERLMVVQGDVTAHHRDLGFMLARAGRPLAAAECLQRYLLLEPEADDSASVRESMKALGEQGARLN